MSTHHASRSLCTYLLGALALFLNTPLLLAQTAPVVEPVYGGTVQACTAIATSSTSTRLFVSTRSANSVFYTDIDHTATAPFSAFQAVPDFDSDDGYGIEVYQVEADATTGLMFVLYDDELIQYEQASGTTTVLEEDVVGIHIYDGHLFYAKIDLLGTYLHFGTLSGTSFTEDTNSPLFLGTRHLMPTATVRVSPTNEQVYVFEHGEPPTLYASSDAYHSLASTTSFSTVPTSASDIGAYPFRAFGIAPDGRLFIGGVEGAEPNHFKYIAYSDDDGSSWTTFTSSAPHTAGPNFAFGGDASAYYVYLGDGMSTTNGESGSWSEFGSSDLGVRVEDGPVCVDPNNTDIVYAPTDLGIAMSTDRGISFSNIVDGLQAIQVNDFAMNLADKTIGWAASKSGIRRVTGYQTSSESWELFYPWGDGSPYFSVIMDTSDVTGNTAFVGNTRVYWTTDGGSSWDQIQPEVSSFSFFTRVSAIAVDPNHSDGRIFAAYYDEQETKGGLFVGEYDSSIPDWTFTQITGSAMPSDGVDFYDIVIVTEDSATVVYAGAEYHHDASVGTARSVYRIEEDGAGGWTVSQDMLNATQNISATIMDLTVTSDGTLYACGTDAGGTGANIYTKALGATEWTALTTSGVSGGSPCSSITVDETTGDTYIASDHELYVLGSSDTAWSSYYSYPVGTAINFLFYDDLLVGTDTGLYMHPAHATGDSGDPTGTAIEVHPSEMPRAFVLHAAYPNPFNPQTTLRFSVHETMPVTLRVFDALGRQVARLFDGLATASETYAISFEATNLPSGLYLYQLETPAGHEARTMVLMK